MRTLTLRMEKLSKGLTSQPRQVCCVKLWDLGEKQRYWSHGMRTSGLITLNILNPQIHLKLQPIEVSQ
jgi:hypothetical protein